MHDLETIKRMNSPENTKKNREPLDEKTIQSIEEFQNQVSTENKDKKREEYEIQVYNEYGLKPIHGIKKELEALKLEIVEAEMTRGSFMKFTNCGDAEIMADSTEKVSQLRERIQYINYEINVFEQALSVVGELNINENDFYLINL